ncbi:hypothetical protein L9F63_010377, partial [Diploptera punctata]
AIKVFKRLAENLYCFLICIPMLLDLGSLESVKTFAKEVLDHFPTVPVSEGQKTKDGFEINFGINHLGHFLLTNLLLPRLKESAPSRIVIVSSMLHEKGKIDFENLNGEKGFIVKRKRENPGYCNSKLANMYFHVELTKRLEGTGVDCFALCPGFVYTSIFRYSRIKWYHYMLFSPIALIYLRTPSQAVSSSLHCTEELEGKSGHFYRNCDFYESKIKFEPHIAQKLWESNKQFKFTKEIEDYKTNTVLDLKLVENRRKKKNGIQGCIDNKRIRKKCL